MIGFDNYFIVQVKYAIHEWYAQLYRYMIVDNDTGVQIRAVFGFLIALFLFDLVVKLTKSLFNIYL